jgi:homoserine kinase type II
MAVYTPLTDDEVAQCLSDFDGVSVKNFSPILSGIENSNFLITAEDKKYILTLLESRTSSDALPFIFEFMQQLGKNGIIVPSPVINKHGQKIFKVKGKTAILMSYLEGRGVTRADINDGVCFAAGKLLAQIHKAGAGVKAHWRNSMNLSVTTHLSKNLHHPLAPLIHDEINYQKSCDYSSLPRGAIHGDFFPDNVFIDDAQHICGVIDFYYACTEIYLYDIALAFNAWCFDDGVIHPSRADSFLNAYQEIRAFSDLEKESFSNIARWAALRILTTRAFDSLKQNTDYLVVAKDPTEYQKILTFHQKENIFAR